MSAMKAAADAAIQSWRFHLVWLVLAMLLLAPLAGLRGGRASAAEALGFGHGVASGDPLSDGFILWTRVSAAAGGSHAGRPGG